MSWKKGVSLNDWFWLAPKKIMSSHFVNSTQISFLPIIQMPGFPGRGIQTSKWASNRHTIHPRNRNCLRRIAVMMMKRASPIMFWRPPATDCPAAIQNAVDKWASTTDKWFILTSDHLSDCILNLRRAIVAGGLSNIIGDALFHHHHRNSSRQCGLRGWMVCRVEAHLEVWMPSTEETRALNDRKEWYLGWIHEVRRHNLLWSQSKTSRKGNPFFHDIFHHLSFVSEIVKMDNTNRMPLDMRRLYLESSKIRTSIRLKTPRLNYKKRK